MVGQVKEASDPVFRGLALRFNKLFPELMLEIEPTATEVRDRAGWLVEHTGDGKTEGLIQGTAFFLKSVGLVTAWHCVEGATNIDCTIRANRPTIQSDHLEVRCAP